MPPLFYAILVSVSLLALSLLALVRAFDLLDDRRSSGAYRATWWQRRAWASERKRAGWQRARN